MVECNRAYHLCMVISSRKILIQDYVGLGTYLEFLNRKLLIFIISLDIWCELAKDIVTDNILISEPPN